MGASDPAEGKSDRASLLGWDLRTQLLPKTDHWFCPKLKHHPKHRKFHHQLTEVYWPPSILVRIDLTQKCRDGQGRHRIYESALTSTTQKTKVYTPVFNLSPHIIATMLREIICEK